MMKKGATFFPAEGGGGGGKSSGLKCNIVLLDGREVQLEINKKTPGQWIFDHVSGKLGVTEREYFGLLYEDEQKCQQWLEMAKPIKKQIKKNHSKVFYCVRLYPPNPLLISESTRIQLYWQLKRDFTSGRLPCLADTTLQLVALMAQVEIGDWSGQQCIDYNVQLKLHKEEVELHQGDISSRHQHLRGTSESDARGLLLKLVNLLEFYGMVFFDVRYEDKVHYMLGMSPFGLALCKKMKIAQSYNWSRVVQVLYRGRKFIVRVSGDWVKNNKFQQLNFDVDSSKTCKDLYNTFVEHINFYTKRSSSKKQEEGGDNETFTQMPVSSSIENLSRQLSKEKDNGREDRLHRSLSLPRRTKNKIDMQSLFQAPPITNTSLNDPVLQALQSRRPNRTHSLSPTHPSDPPGGTYVDIDALTIGMGPRTNSLDPESQSLGMKQFDMHSLDSHDIPIHDSLMDLAEGLGSGSNVDGEEESFVIEDLDSSPGRKHRSSSLPHIAVLDSVSTASQDNSPVNASKQGKRGQSTSDDKLQSRKLLLSWVKEQKKKDQVKVSTEDQKNSTDSFPQLTTPTLPALSKAFSGSSPSQIYKLKTKGSPPIERPSSSLLPHMSSARSHPYDIYDVPRPSPVPSPYLYKRPYQSNSGSAYSSRHSVSNIGEENDYDIPRSLTDLRRVDSPYLMRTGTRSNEHMAYSRASSCSEHTSQAALLKDEYPDYDIPRPSDSIDDPDYDVPRSVKSMGTVDSKSEGNISFGALDKIMADIDMQVAGTVVQDGEREEGKSVATNVDNGSPHQSNKQPNIVGDSTEDLIEQAEENMHSDEKPIIRSSTADEEDISSQTQLDKDIITSVEAVAKERTISPPNMINESTLAKRILRPLAHQPLSLPQIPMQIQNQSLQESAYDRLAARQALEQLKKDGIVPMDAHERKKQPVEEGGVQKENKRSKTFSSGGSGAILPKLEDLLHGNSNPGMQRMPFDPTFFARQTAFEQKQLLQQQQQLKPDHRTLPEHENQSRQNGAETRDHKSNSASKLPEPIYQEITELSNHRSQRSWSGSRSNLVSNTIVPVGESGHKRTYSGGDMLSVKRSGSVAVRSEMGGDRWGTESVRGSVRHPPPHRINILHQQETNDDESIPNSPSFYTKNPEAATMPDSSSKQQHFFKDLTSLDNNNPPTGGHNRVMNWMQHGTPWDGGAGQIRGGVAPVQLERSVSMSQSTHSQLSSKTGLSNQASQFKDHLYEDPDHLKSKLQSSMRVPGTSAGGARSLPRVSSLSRSALPYVTRELPSSKPGSTMYATDV